MRNNFIFNYATEYFYTHESIPDAKNFKLTDEEYQEFVSWLSNKKLEYTTQVEEDIQKLITSARQEKYYEDIKSHILTLQQETLHNKNQDLIKFKPEIKLLLEREIAARYYLQKGMIEVTFDQDPEIKAAVEVLDDEERYASILNNQ